MHLQKLAPLPTHQHPADSLNQVLSGLRWRLGFERLALFGVRGVIGASVTLIGLACAMWLVSVEARWLGLAAAPLLAALVFGVVRWPTQREVAIVVDRRFGLEERLTTAVELADRPSPSRFGLVQLHDAVTHASGLPNASLTFDGRTRQEAFLALAAALVAAIMLLLLPRVAKPVATTPQTETTATDELASTPDELAQRALPLDIAEQALPAAAPARPAASTADLAARVQQEQAERSALDKLAQALSNISAGQPAADAIQQGDLEAARDQLENLADNADQLTDAAKRQLASALQQAAAGTAQTDKALADREQQAAQALSRSVYTEQRQALRALADQVQRSAARSVPADQLERDLGQLQQQTQATRDAGTATLPGGQSGESAQSGAGQGAGTTSGGQAGDGAGQQTGAGIGTGTDPNLYADQPSRLDTSGQQVQVPLKLGTGAGVRPADGSEDQAAPRPGVGTRSTAELAQTQQTGQVAPEQNLVPSEQRPVVRGYFR